MNKDDENENWWVYVIESNERGCTYVGVSKNPDRRLKEHNGEKGGGAKFTSGFDDWQPRALYGPYEDRGSAQSAEYYLKKESGSDRFDWNHEMRKGAGSNHEWVKGGGSHE
jgi:putative endonuclease